MISNLIFTGYNYAKGKNNYAEKRTIRVRLKSGGDQINVQTDDIVGQSNKRTCR